MNIRLYESWQDENMNRNCCICSYEYGDYVIDFGNYKTSLCENCIDRFIEELQKCKKARVCGHCKYRVPGNHPGPSYRCNCETSNNFNYDAYYYNEGCKQFKHIGDDDE